MLVIQEHLQEVVKQSVFEMLIVSLIGCYGTLFEMLRRLKGWPETISFVRFGSVSDICKRSCLLHLRKRTCAVQLRMSAKGQKRTLPKARQCIAVPVRC